MCVDFLPEIWHIAVADFKCRPIENFEKGTSNVGGYVSAKRGVVSDDVAVTILFLERTCRMR